MFLHARDREERRLIYNWRQERKGVSASVASRPVFLVSALDLVSTLAHAAESHATPHPVPREFASDRYNVTEVQRSSAIAVTMRAPVVNRGG